MVFNIPCDLSIWNFNRKLDMCEFINGFFLEIGNFNQQSDTYGFIQHPALRRELRSYPYSLNGEPRSYN